MELSSEHEARRTAAVRRYDILDTPLYGAFARIAAPAARLFEVPAATVTIVDTERVWTRGCAPRRSSRAALWSSPTSSTTRSPAPTYW
ncbi:hypothetical protein [Streptomyces sp. NPDC050534]|uniref:hypothetical protein n=1 Tax=Streptomyces sp. NPDC050534 TaxID=3365625 RepID=UPI0037A9A97E